MFKQLLKYLILQVKILEKNLELANKTCNEIDVKKRWDLETGEKFNNLICEYPISEEQLLSISETVCKFVSLTRITNIDKYLFTDKKLQMPRIIRW